MKFKNIFQNIKDKLFIKSQANYKFISDFDFSNTFSNNFKDAIKLQKDFVFIYQQLNNLNKKRFLLNTSFVFNKENYTYYLSKHNDNNFFEFHNVHFYEKIQEDYENINNDLFLDLQSISYLKNKIDFIKHIDGYYKVIDSKSKKILFNFKGLLPSGELKSFSKISLYEFYFEIYIHTRDVLMDKIEEYNKEVKTISDNIIKFNNKFIQPENNIINLLNNNLKEHSHNISDNLNVHLFLSEEEKKAPYKMFNIQQSIMLDQQIKKSNTYGFNLSNKEIIKNIQKNLENEFSNILNNFKNTLITINKTSIYSEIAFLGVNNTKKDFKIFNPIINEMENVYQLSGDVIISEYARNLMTINLTYTNHTLLYFSIKNKNKNDFENIIEKGFTNYYSKFRIKEIVTHF
jgi:hypothetical protein